jgi:hypothetical protein
MKLQAAPCLEIISDAVSAELIVLSPHKYYFVLKPQYKIQFRAIQNIPKALVHSVHPFHPLSDLYIYAYSSVIFTSF